MPLWKKILVGVGVLWLIGIIAGVLVSSGNTMQSGSAVADLPTAKKTEKEPTIGEMVVIKKQSWQLDGFNTVFIANLTIENKNKINLKDFIVECQTLGGSGTELDTVRKTVYETLPAGKTKNFKGINMGFVSSQSKRAGCSIIGALPEGYK